MEWLTDEIHANIFASRRLTGTNRKKEWRMASKCTDSRQVGHTLKGKAVLRSVSVSPPNTTGGMTTRIDVKDFNGRQVKYQRNAVSTAH
jgi:hypothetical protein